MACQVVLFPNPSPRPHELPKNNSGDWGGEVHHLAMLPRLAVNSWVQVSLSSQPPKCWEYKVMAPCQAWWLFYYFYLMEALPTDATPASAGDTLEELAKGRAEGVSSSVSVSCT